MGRKRKRTKSKRPARLKAAATGYVARTVNAAEKRHVRQQMHRAALAAAEIFPEALQSLLDTVRDHDPLEIVMGMSGALFASVTDAGVIEHDPMRSVQQSDVELLLGLMGSLAPDEWGNKPAGPLVIQRVIDAAQMARESFGATRMLALKEDDKPSRHTELALQERIRLHTQVIRNWGYHHRVVALSRELYGTLDGQLAVAVGFSASNVITLFEALVKLREEQYTDRLLRMRRVLSLDSIEQMVHAYYREHPDMAGAPEQFIKAIPAEVTIEGLKVRLFAHSEYRMVPLALVDVDTLVSRTGLGPGLIESILKAVAHVPTAVEEAKLGHLLLGNPAWECPAIAYKGLYAVPAPQIFFSHVHRIMNRLFASAGLSEKLRHQRATILEQRTEEAFRIAFQASTLLPGGKWRWDGKAYETDLIVLLDRTLLIVEAKSAELSPSALRGAPDRLKRHIHDAVEHPAIQSKRLEDVIALARKGNHEARAVTTQLGIPITALDTILRLSVTLDDYSPIAAMGSELKEAGWLAGDTDLAPVISIADLECLFDLLEKPAHILHYLKTRTHLQKRVTLMGDELDCLGSYLADGLVVPRIDGRPILQIIGQSSVVDRYFVNQSAGIASEKPRRNLPLSFDRLLAALETRGAAGWTTISLAVLNGMDTATARDLDRCIEDLRQSVPAERNNSSHRCCCVFVPDDESDPVMLYYIYCAVDSAARHERASILATETIERTGRGRCVVVGRMIEDWETPYRFFLIAGH